MPGHGDVHMFVDGGVVRFIDYCCGEESLKPYLWSLNPNELQPYEVGTQLISRLQGENFTQKL